MEGVDATEFSKGLQPGQRAHAAYVARAAREAREARESQAAHNVEDPAEDPAEEAQVLVQEASATAEDTG